MPFLESLIASIIAVFVAQGFQQVSAQQKGENIVVQSEGQQIATIPIIEPITQKPLDFAQSSVDRIISTLTQKPDKAQLELSSQDRDTTLYNLSLVPNANFKTVGKAQVKVNGKPLVDIDAATFTDISSFNVPLPDAGLLLVRGNKIEVFVWSDGTSVSLTVSTLIGGHL